MEHAKLNDIIELKNGLIMRVCEDDDRSKYFKTVDIKSGEDVTTSISKDSLKEYFIGNKVYGYGCSEYEIISINNKDLKVISGLTDQELNIMNRVLEGYGEWLKLEMTHPCEMQDFVNAIHNIQSILAMRVMRRGYPEYWLTHKS